jgi:5-methylcytosine-specific restriction protein A
MAKPRTVCSYPGCPELAVAHGRCAAHQQPRARQPDTRPSARQRGYDTSWGGIRLRYLAMQSTCEICGALATQVHHIVRLEDGGTHDMGNLQALCASCHNRIHAHGRGRSDTKVQGP